MSRPPAGEPWTWQTRELRMSDAWRSQSINCRRLIDFLMIELMNHSGKRNGELKAPQWQLVDFGIGAQYIAQAISEAENPGLIDRRLGGMRVATRYALTWLPLHDETVASNRWRHYENPSLKPLSGKNSRSRINKQS
jgi:hypothetical protein